MVACWIIQAEKKMKMPIILLHASQESACNSDWSKTAREVTLLASRVIDVNKTKIVAIDEMMPIHDVGKKERV